MSTSADLCALCSDIPLFAGLSTEQCRTVIDLAERCEFPAGEVLVHQGREVQRLWILLQGTCVVTKAVQLNGQESIIELATLTPYATFGEMSFFHRAPHSASVRAESSVSLLRMERPQFDGLLARDPIAAFHLARNTVAHVADRLRRMDLWVAELLGSRKATQVDELDRLRDQLFKQWAL